MKNRNTKEQDKLRRMRRVLAGVVELASAIAEDWTVEYARFMEGQLSGEPDAFMSLASMRHKMVDLGGDAEPLLRLLSVMSEQDKKFADAQYAKLIKARDGVLLHDEHYQAELKRVLDQRQDPEA